MKVQKNRLEKKRNSLYKYYNIQYDLYNIILLENNEKYIIKSVSLL